VGPGLNMCACGVNVVTYETVHGARLYCTAAGAAARAARLEMSGVQATATATETATTGYRGTVDALLTITRVEGLPGLYRGLTPSLMMAVPSTVLYYSTYDSLRARIERAGGCDSWRHVMATGGG
jgi:hypothetical protein